MISGRLLDVAAVETAITGRTLYARAMIAAALQQGNAVAIPAPALAVGLARIPGPLRRQGLAALLGVAVVVVEPFGERDAAAAADLLAGARPPSTDITAAAVALAGRRRGWPILTDRAAELLALDAALRTEPLP
ncbi:hypothetical protein [Actinomadura montaniterrae]|uniref:Type II toxin-antitoxin system VapC family toxin n=1 Tax=Actinomadura montaniterrae TaxID=1803903 RepID=A0A6L3VPU0_9ACTN|nr:hypothetical protein [Actinomadura montaniterrae]KAB2376982.1 hypothetical protein F9B16_24415 [Actinomadura montaniterrae]